MGERPVCEGCGRPMSLTDAESIALQRREVKEFEDVLYPNGKGKPTPLSASSTTVKSGDV